jgi:ABC-type nitrate/sulfonate/bicarbonate transport system substrate-binding protein
MRRTPDTGRLSRWLRRAGAALSSALALAGAAAAQDLRLAVARGPVSLPIYVAEAQGYFEREGVAVRLQECATGRSCFQLLAQKQADLATGSELLVTLDSFKGTDAVIIATISSSTRHIKLVARRSAGIQGPQDLKGKRVATVPGTSAQYFLDRWLVFHDLDPKTVAVRPLPLEQLTDELKGRKVDAIAIWEPVAAAAIGALAQDALVLPSPRVYTQHFNLVTTRAAIAQREADMVKLLRALLRAERFIAEQPSPARQILKARLQGDPGLDSLAEHDFKLTLEQTLIATMEGQARWALRQGHAQDLPGNLLRSIESSLLLQAAPDAVSLVR